MNRTTLTKQSASRPSLRAMLARTATLWTVLAALSVWCGCTVTKSNYATLSLFFDGVPDPNATGASGEGAAGDTTLALAVISHKPFLEEKCESCHKTQYRPSRNDPSACLSCHDKVLNQHQWTHGAVAGGACLWCHSPHESARKWLLRSPDRKLCMQCHSATMMNGSTVPAHVDPKSGCIECHFAHGGQNSLMLRPGATATSAPATTEMPPQDPAEQPSLPSDHTPASTADPVGVPVLPAQPK